MQRENFKITCDNGMEPVIKHAWNSANREVEAIVGNIARTEHSMYGLTDSTSLKVEGYHVKGSRQWTSRDGKVLNFTIEKVDS